MGVDQVHQWEEGDRCEGGQGVGHMRRWGVIHVEGWEEGQKMVGIEKGWEIEKRRVEGIRRETGREIETMEEIEEGIMTVVGIGVVIVVGREIGIETGRVNDEEIDHIQEIVVIASDLVDRDLVVVMIVMITVEIVGTKNDDRVGVCLHGGM